MKLKFGEILDRHRVRLARPDALIHLALVGLASGFLAGFVIVLFRLVVEGAQAAILPGGGPENYESLEIWLRISLPSLGGLIIGWMFYRYGKGIQLLGVARVLERMAYHQGYLTLRGFFLQLFGAATAIVSGHSVGREGPHVFLGAAAGSILGQYLELPNNSIRTLVGCGTAAAIAASFNTPLAGVIFALEVVMMEYSFASFIPVMLAAAAANTVSVAVIGGDPAFQVPELSMGSLREIPLVLVLALFGGAFSALFVHLLQRLAERVQVMPFWIRTTLAGVGVGLLGAMVPEVMGIGYDTVNHALLGQIGLNLLLVMLAFKLLATVISVGMGIPGGMIGPALFLGAVLGSLFALVVNSMVPHLGVDVGFYALLGMGAVMSASLQAPLAALVAMMELTYSPQIVMPGILVVVVAGLVASEVFKKESIFTTVLKTAGMKYDSSPLLQTLRGVGVAGVMDRRFVRVGQVLPLERAHEVLANEPRWLLVYGGQHPVALMPAVELVRYLQGVAKADFNNEPIDLMEIPGQRLQLAPVSLQANLQEALECLENAACDALYVERLTAPGVRRVYGILTRQSVESVYRY
ncbi:MAG: chloride channel protein [Gammaproteobacteria bacterium]|nr:chloride channel protein [Gammaproteobacteria bacterium]